MLFEGFTIGALVIAALADSINPCTFGILLFLLATLSAEKSKKHVLLGGSAFILAIFLSYILIGLGLCKAFSFFSVKIWFYYIIGSLSIVIGLFNFYEYKNYEKRGCKYNPRLQKILNKVTSAPMMFVAGIFCALFLLPCTAGPYVIITGMLANSFSLIGFLLLILYNIIFVLPLVIIVGLSYFEYAFVIEKLHAKMDKYAPLILGGIMFLIGLILIIYNYIQSLAPAICAI